MKQFKLIAIGFGIGTVIGAGIATGFYATKAKLKEDDEKDYTELSFEDELFKDEDELLHATYQLTDEAGAFIVPSK